MITVLVDLDGTITDPAPGMIGAFRFALERMGVAPPPAEDLLWIIGPPARRSFPKLLRPDQDVEEAVRLYRERYGSGGLFTPWPFLSSRRMTAMLGRRGRRSTASACSGLTRLRW